MTELNQFSGWRGLERVRLPRSPLPAAAPPGLEVRQIDTPEALAAEGTRMNHCVGAWLPRVMEGETWVYSVRIAGEPITVALERLPSGRIGIVEARRAHDELPTAFQRKLIEVWVERVNQARTP